MTFGIDSAIEWPTAELQALAPRFARAFEHASERRLRTLYDAVATRLSEAFQGLVEAATEQVEVLNKVAEMVGLEGLDLDQPLPDEAGEALAQRVAWRSASRWAVLSLLWTLVERRETPMTPEEWARAAADHDGKRPRSRSSLPPADESTALGLAADGLVRSPTFVHGTGMAVLDVPVLLRSVDQGSAVAVPVSPLALVETRSAWSGKRIEVRADDRILPADDSVVFSLEAEYEAIDGGAKVLGEGSFSLPDQASAVGVARGCWLLIKR